MNRCCLRCKHRENTFENETISICIICQEKAKDKYKLQQETLLGCKAICTNSKVCSNKAKRDSDYCLVHKNYTPLIQIVKEEIFSKEYFAGFFDSCGNINITNFYEQEKITGFLLRIEIDNTEECLKMYQDYYGGKINTRSGKIYRICGKMCISLIRDLLPYSIFKIDQLKIANEFVMYNKKQNFMNLKLSLQNKLNTTKKEQIKEIDTSKLTYGYLSGLFDFHGKISSKVSIVLPHIKIGEFLVTTFGGSIIEKEGYNKWSISIDLSIPFLKAIYKDNQLNKEKIEIIIK